MESQPLNTVQRWMQSVIMHPGGVAAGMDADGSRKLLDVAPGDLEQVIDRSSSQTSAERLAVYANAYFSRLIECLESDFPVFRQTVGDDAFAQFAVNYLQQYPSQSYTLAKLGENFPRYLAETKPSPNSDETQIGWADFLIELASLERTFSEVFDGPGAEHKTEGGRRKAVANNNSSTISAEDLMKIKPDDWPRARLTTVLCLRLLSLRFPLNDFYTAAKNGNHPAIPQPAESWLAVTRRDFIVRRYELSRPQFALLEAIERGETIGEAIGHAAEFYPGEIDELAGELRHWFRIWTAAPMFAAIEFNTESNQSG